MKNIVIKFLALFMLFTFSNVSANEAATHSTGSNTHKEETYQAQTFSHMVTGFLKSTGIVAFVSPNPDELNAKVKK